jgi:anti-sigma28 factor (negative regulator of flagellin synthesis)
VVASFVTEVTPSSADDATLYGMDVREKASTGDDPTDEERRKKVAALKRAVAEGTYHVSAEQLADKLIDHMLEPKG